MLTKQDIKALRHADSIVFRMRPESNGDGVKSTLEAIKRGDNTSDGFEQTHYIQVNHSITNYDRNAKPDYIQYGFYMIHAAQMREEWQTIAGLLREGDEVRFHWIANNNSENLEKAGFVRDMLRLQVYRNEGKKPLVFHVADEVTPIGSSARMLRHGVWG